MTLCTAETDWGCADPAWVAELPPEVKARAEQLAWSTLQALTGYRLAVCPVMVRPCAQGCADAAQTWDVAPVSVNGFAVGGTFSPGLNLDGRWVNSCGCRPNGCSCTQLSVARLVGPVGRVHEVRLDGAVLDPSAYRVDNGFELVRTDGGVWPTCQDMTKPITEPNTFGVSYFMGIAPDAIASFAAGLLAVEYAKACTGKKCALPSNVTSITRQGVSIEVSAGLFPGNSSGIQAVDAFVFTLNPYGLKSAPRVSSPDFGRPRMRTA